LKAGKTVCKRHETAKKAGYMTEFRREKRKTLTLQINAEGNLIVKAPLNMSERVIQQFLEDKRDWIAFHQNRILEKASQYVDHRYEPGEPFWFLGEVYPLVKMETVEKPRFDVAKKCFMMPKTGKAGTSVESEVQAAYRAAFLEYLEQRIPILSKQMNVNPRKIGIKVYKSQWGNAKNTRDIHFNLRLALAPRMVAEYVLIHELAHLKHMDHSKAFWRFVELQDPEYAEHRAWLKRNGSYLNFSRYKRLESSDL